MELDTQPDIVEQATAYPQDGWQAAQGWLLSPAAWSQFALLVAAFLLALLVSRRLKGPLTRLLTPPDSRQHVLAQARRMALRLLPLLLPLLAYVLTGLGEAVTRSLFGSDTVIAFGKRAFLLLGAYIVVRDMLTDPLLKLIGKYLILPAALLNTFGLFDDLTARLQAIVVPLGNMSFDLLWLIKAVIAGGVIFWLGRWSNERSSSYIRAQQELPPATRQLAAKAAEIAIFGAAFLILMNILGISLTSLAVLGGAIGVRLGFGLQKIAANFISGVILLLEGQATVGDYVELDGGEAGTIVRTTARAMIWRPSTGAGS